ncbi:ComF family protein [Candidatus Anaplasma sp. TIGMIC]|uniref:ComF family protein n=1 Tax=Candidatus Anaplasma sp. TIGMIC TaxID=3020713 RepID=UPI00232F753A|nr:phosphoribosyltransferase family protein [Candidatus Anaplasma sp. TIGMIC]MDB1135289.1 phosphoribosyltransferase family protein [Candidatus Anaplasma sp. TIGMIC]
MFDRGRAMLARAAMLVPVPIHRPRLLNRKFNQAALLALELSKLCGVPTEMFILKKYRSTPPQGKLSAAMRSQNVQNSFSVSNPAMVVGRSILLVDDVATTGATLQSCAQTLILAGATEVQALTLARSLRNT